MTVDDSGSATNPARPRIAVTSVTLTAARRRQLADFYARLTGWRVMQSYPAREGEPPDAGWAPVKPPGGTSGPTLNFEWDRHFAVPTWPSEPGEQTASEHLEQHVRVMLDPDGHPFCLFR